MARPVVITRPWEQAEGMAAQVAAAGRQPVVFPLLEIQPLPDQAALRAALARVEACALVAFVSPNAIAAALAARPDWPKQVPLAVVGEGSRRALEAHGLCPPHTRVYVPQDPTRSDSETLLAELDLEALRGREVMIVRGESGRELLADALRASGVTVTAVPAYRRLAPPFDQNRRVQLQGLLEEPHVWIITSSEALRYLLRMAGQLYGDDALARLRGQTLLVPHARIAETAREIGLDDVIQTASGDEALIAALQSLP